MKLSPSLGVTAALRAAALLVVPAALSAQVTTGRFAADCAQTLRDVVTGNCLEASTVPTLGKLYPMSQRLFVNPSTGSVGIGTTFPFRTLEVNGSMGITNNGLTLGVLRPSTSNTFGVLETVGYSSGSGQPVVTNLFSTVSLDTSTGAMATVRGGTTYLVTLTTPANNLNAGYVSVRNANAEVAGINGGTGVVFGASKSFIQPHPLDPTKEIQYVSLEGPEHGVYFRGTARLVGGRVEIPAPESFRLVARREGLTVSVTALGENRGLYVARKGVAGFEVRENQGGTGDVEFDYLVMGKRSAMPEHVAIRENRHFLPERGTTVLEGELPGAYRELMIRNGTLELDGRVSEATAKLLRSRGDAGANGDAAAIARD